MGSFEVTCAGVNLFSKLALGYFPHTILLKDRVIAFLDDLEHGKDLQKYKSNSSPVKGHPTYHQSPQKSAQKNPSKTNYSNKDKEEITEKSQV